MRTHEDVMNIDKKQLEQNWPKEVKTVDAFIDSKDLFIEMLSDFESIWVGHTGSIDTAKHQNIKSSYHGLREASVFSAVADTSQNTQA